MGVRKVFFLIAVAAFSIMSNTAPAHALSIANLTVSPGEIWLNDASPAVSISFACINDSENDFPISSVSASVTGPGGYIQQVKNETFIRDAGNNFRVVLSTPLSGIKEGQYLVRALCESNGTQAAPAQAYFWASSYSTSVPRVNSANSISGSSGLLYTGDKASIEVLAKTTGKTEGYLSSGDLNFQAYFGDYALSISKVVSPGSAGSPWIIEAAIPNSLEELGSAKLRVLSSYNGHSTESSAGGTFSVQNPLEVTIMPPEKPHYFTQATTMTIVVQVASVQGLSIDPAKIKFRAKFDGEPRPILSARNTNSNLWDIQLTIPQKDPSEDSYPLDIVAEYGNATQQSGQSLPIWFTIPFKGQIVDSAGNPIQTKIMVGEDRIIDTGQSGTYDTNITPGTYDIELVMTDLTDIKYKDTVVDDGDSFKYSRSPIKYESFDGSGQEASRIIALEFGYTFGSAEVTIPYDQYGLDRNSVVIYQCSSWNFPKRTCDSSWNPVTALVIDNYAVSFSTGKFFRTAFAVGEKKSISSQLDEANRKNYFIGEGAEVRGKITDNQNNPVSGASVNLTIRGYDIDASTTSDSEGNFLLSFSPPQKEGEYTAEIKCQKDYLSSRTLVFNFKISASEQLGLSMQNYADLEFGKLATITGTLRNTGQKQVRNIAFSISNPPFSGFQIEPQQIESLDVGEEKEIKATITLSRSECTNCQSQYSIEIDARGESGVADAKGSFILNMKGVASSDSQSNATAAAAAPKSTSGSTTAKITGFATSETNMISGKIGEAAQMLSAYSAADIFLALLIAVLGFKVVTRRKDEAKVFEPPPQVQYRSDPIEKIRDVKREILKGQEEKK